MTSVLSIRFAPHSSEEFVYTRSRVNMSAEKKSLLIKGLEFYDFVKDIVRDGDIELIDNMVEFYRKPFGCQIYVKSYQNKKLVLVHNLLGEREIVVPVQES